MSLQLWSKPFFLLVSRPGKKPSSPRGPAFARVAALRRGGSLSAAGSAGVSRGAMHGASRNGLARSGKNVLKSNAAFIVLVALFVCVLMLNSMFLASEESGVASEGSKSTELSVSTWNVAAINNNPFEYWLTYDSAEYGALMKGVEDFVESPKKQVAVRDVFTPKMFEELTGLMAEAGMDADDVTVVERMWNEDLSGRDIVSDFLKDPLIGKKRLASMPDRTTNTATLEDGRTDYRPTVINCFEQPMGSVAEWWDLWKRYMFSADGGSVRKAAAPYVASLRPIKRSKYPMVTEEEERVSLPLQTLALAIFDSILVHMITSVSRDGWQEVRSTICASLNKRKAQRTLEILREHYRTRDVIFLQETASSFADRVRADERLGLHYFVVEPQDRDAGRDQNSILLLWKFTFRHFQEVTKRVVEAFDGDSPVAPGDLLCVMATMHNGRQLLLCSFHGDTNGLASVPVVRAVKKASDRLGGEHRLVFGLDANTYKARREGVQNVLAFADAVRAAGLTSIYGDDVDEDFFTTFNARTYLQPQLNKAARAEEKAEKGDRNPKDFVLLSPGAFAVRSVWRDNKGDGRTYDDEMVFPTLSFPSDHGILSADLVPLL